MFDKFPDINDLLKDLQELNKLRNKYFDIISGEKTMESIEAAERELKKIIIDILEHNYGAKN